MSEVHVEICMGSACHSRGNFETAQLLQAYQEQEPRIRLSGALCRDRCSEGPIVTIDGQSIANPDPVMLKQLIAQAIEQQERVTK